MENPFAQPTFHAGEVYVQSRLGVAEQAERIGSKFIRPFLPEQHRECFTQLPHIIIGATDTEGQPWATYMSGDDGFIQSPSDTVLDIQASLPSADPLERSLRTGQKIGLLGIQLENRRRNRLNGVISTHSASRISVQVDQSYGNCPKYIHKRKIKLTPKIKNLATPKISSELSSDLQNIIQKADVFFIASRTASLTSDINSGVDVSHRGGESGFIDVIDSKTFKFADYPGNRFFNTLGNIQSDGRVGLLFFDFKNSQIIQIAAHASIEWEGDDRSTLIKIDQVRTSNTSTITSDEVI